MPWRARCRETGTTGSASGLEKRTGSNPGTALQADSTTAQIVNLRRGMLHVRSHHPQSDARAGCSPLHKCRRRRDNDRHVGSLRSC
jgi:hypothetical protein